MKSYVFFTTGARRHGECFHFTYEISAAIRPGKITRREELDRFTTRARRHGAQLKFSWCLRLLMLFLASFHNAGAQPVVQPLNSGWQFSEAGKNEWLPASVPGTVHTDLLANGKIPDPYYGLNEGKVQWVENKTWEYKSVFDCDKKLWKQKNKALCFDGLDTYADIYLNDSLLLTAEDMFLPYSLEVSRLIKKKQNILRIVFHPASELIARNKAKEDFKNLPGGDRVFIRKAQYQFGWDWGPRLLTCGIWKPVRLEGWTGPEIEAAEIYTDAIDDSIAYLGLNIDYREIMKPGQKMRVRIYDDSGTVYYDQRNSFSETARSSSIRFRVEHPRLWWCNGMGKPEMYSFTCEFTFGKKKITRNIRHGIRSVELDRHPDAAGFSQILLLNGKPVFCKGANWIPCDNFLPRISTDQYYRLLKNAQLSNMNMLRVWGGGVYEDDRFYAICDSLGLMIWQDFMFAGGMVPGGLGFFQTVQAECAVQFHRIHQHPCATIWCGNNESTEGWFNWGWQHELNLHGKDSSVVFNNYQHIFYSEIGQLLSRADRNVIYWPSSPSYGWGTKEAYNRGDVHYWGVWWGMEPFSAYETHVGRFVSEYGFQGMPDLHSFDAFAGNRFLSLTDTIVRAHQKHPSGYETIGTYMQRDYPVPARFEDYVYVSQVMQLEGISRAIEAHRRARPYCMGTLLWQLDDCWPVTSWSTIDYYGRPKLLQYALKDLYAPLLVSVTERNDSVLVYLVNDDLTDHEGKLEIFVSDFYGKDTRKITIATTAPAEDSRMVAGFKRSELLDTLKPEKAVMRAVFTGDRKQVSSTHWFAPSKLLALPAHPPVDLKLGPVSEIILAPDLTISSPVAVKNLMLYSSDPNVRFSENGFSLMPGEQKTIQVYYKGAEENLRKDIRLFTINDLLPADRN